MAGRAMLDFLQSLSDGLLFGATYALIGIGFTLVFGVMHKINMAYAAASVGGAYCRPAGTERRCRARAAWLVFLARVPRRAACSATSSTSPASTSSRSPARSRR